MNQMQIGRRTLLQSINLRVVGAAALAIALLAGATRVYATSLTWTNTSGIFSTAENWDPAQPPADTDTLLFTNDTSYTVSLTADGPALLSSCTFTGHAGVVTLDLGTTSTLFITNRFRVGPGDATATVFMNGGTLDVENFGLSQIRIGESGANQSSMGKFVVQSGTVIAEYVNVGPTTNGSGTLVVSGPAVWTWTPNNGGSITVGNNGANSSLLITNGGRMIIDGEIRIGSGQTGSNNFALVSGSGSVLSNFAGAGLFVGNGGTFGNNVGNLLIISNGATVFTDNGGTFGGSSCYNTVIVTGVGSKLIGGTATNKNMIVGTGSVGSTNNDLTIADGGYLFGGGTMSFGNNVGKGNTIHMGGTGAPSTGFAVVVRNASTATEHSMFVSNAVFGCSYLNPQGTSNSVFILAKGTVVLASPVSNHPTNVMSLDATSGRVVIDGGTLSAVSGTNAIAISISGTGGNALIITNGGKLLTEQVIFANGSLQNTAIVTGAGSVWSNSTGSSLYTNSFSVGSGAGGSNNYLAVVNGASLFNAGTFNIGNNITASVNLVSIGGVGLPSTVVNSGSLNIGSSSNTYGNALTVTNATLNCGTLNVGNSGATNNLLDIRKGGTISVNFVRVRPANTVNFDNGTLSVGGLTFDTLANDGNAFVVGDGTSAATYVMTNGGTGFHNFNDGGLVITNNASLRGNGTIEGNVTILGTFAPGFSVGSVGSIYASNDLTFGSSATLNYDLGTSSDSVTVNGDLALGGTVNVTDSGGFVANTYVLFTHTNTVTGTLTVGTLPAGFSATVSTNTLPLVQLIVTGGVGEDPFTTWQTHYGLTGANALGTADPDGDGMSNTKEFLAGFNPTSSAAYLHVISVVRTANNITVTYLGASGDSTYTGGPASRTNVLEFTTGTANGSYSNNFASTGQTNILSGGTGLGTVSSFVDTNGATGATRYYRVRVLVP